MEAIIGWVVIIIFYVLIKAAFSSSSGGSTSATNMRALEVRTRKGPLQEEDPDSPEVIFIEARGIFPIRVTTRVGFITSVFDETDGTLQPVIAELEAFQESASAAFQHTINAGLAEPASGYVEWSRVGVVPLSLLYPPGSGERKLAVVWRVVDLSNPPEIEAGFGGVDHPGLLHISKLSVSFTYDGIGYSEAAENRDAARGLSIHLAMSVAMADGALDDSEGETIRNWIVRTVAAFRDERHDELKSLYNDALRSAYAKARAGELSLTGVTREMNELADEPQKFEAIELCFDVMAADGVMEDSEIAMIRQIADALELDYQEIEQLRDKHLLELGTDINEQRNVEEMLGIDASWKPDRIREHLRKEYAKWNNRLTALQEGQERDSAQRMLDIIAEARKKYA